MRLDDVGPPAQGHLGEFSASAFVTRSRCADLGDRGPPWAGCRGLCTGPRTCRPCTHRDSVSEATVNYETSEGNCFLLQLNLTESLGS